MSSKYNPSRDRFLRHCTLNGCTEPVVICRRIMEDGKMCGQHGHPDFYKNSDTTLMAQVKHAHFLPNIDIGRNVFHSQSEIRAPRAMMIPTWRTPRGRNRWQRIPDEVKRNLGWD